MRTFLALLALVALAGATALKQQQPAVASADSQAPIKIPLKATNKMFCTLCMDLVKDIEGMPEDEAVVYLKKEIKKVCGNVTFFSELCNAALDAVVDEMVHYVAQHFSPEDVCKKVDLC